MCHVMFATVDGQSFTMRTQSCEAIFTLYYSGSVAQLAL
jgi:hypothetical protein